MCAKQLLVDDLLIAPVDPKSPIPLYYQVEENLRELLKSQRIASGDLLPPEIELAKAYRVGRHTIRTALARLAADNLVNRKAGHGTVIKLPQDRHQFSLAHSFTRQMAAMGLTARSEVLEKSNGFVPSSNPPRALRDKAGTPCLQLMRLRFGNDEPIGIQHTVVITQHCHGLHNYDFSTHSLYEILSNEYRLAIVEITHTIGAVTAEKAQAALLGVQVGDPLLLVNTSAFLDDQEIIEFSSSFYRADKYEYTTRQIVDRS